MNHSALATKPNHETREAWLEAGAALIVERLFEPAGIEVPEFRVAFGFMVGGRKAIGQCWKKSASSDKTSEVFIDPSLGQYPVEMLDTLGHELVHVADDCDSGHRNFFVKTCKAIGYTKAPRWTNASAGPEAKETLAAIADELGPFPGGRVSRQTKRGKGRMKKLACGCDRGGLFCSQKRIDEFDAIGEFPLCPICEEPFSPA